MWIRGREGVGSCPLPSLRLRLPFLFPPFPFPPLPFPSPPLPLEVDPLIHAARGEIWAGSGAEPQPKLNLVHFSVI